MIDKMTERIARKPHNCKLCGHVIKPKEKYFYRVSNYFDFTTEKFCTHCIGIMQDFWSVLNFNDSYSTLDLREWVHDTYCDGCPNKTDTCHFTSCDTLREIRGE